MSENPDAIRQEIEETRARLGPVCEQLAVGRKPRIAIRRRVALRQVAPLARGEVDAPHIVVGQPSLLPHRQRR